jgi:hypothetical protein
MADEKKKMEKQEKPKHQKDKRRPGTGPFPYYPDVFRDDPGINMNSGYHSDVPFSE